MNVFKVVLISVGMVAAGYFYCHTVSSKILNIQFLAIAIFITGFILISYGILQSLTLKIRANEIFIRKWYGGRPKHIFMIIFADHLIIVGLSVLISVLSVDILDQFNILPAISKISEYQGFYLSIFCHAVLLILIGSLTLGKLSSARISELILKIS